MLLKPHHKCSTHLTDPVMKSNLGKRRRSDYSREILWQTIMQRMCFKIPGKGVLHQLEGKHLSLKLQKRIAFQRTMRGNKLLKRIKRENLEAWKKPQQYYKSNMHRYKLITKNPTRIVSPEKIICTCTHCVPSFSMFNIFMVLLHVPAEILSRIPKCLMW